MVNQQPFDNSSMQRVFERTTVSGFVVAWEPCSERPFRWTVLKSDEQGRTVRLTDKSKPVTCFSATRDMTVTYMGMSVLTYIETRGETM